MIFVLETYFHKNLAMVRIFRKKQRLMALMNFQDNVNKLSDRLGNIGNKLYTLTLDPFDEIISQTGSALILRKLNYLNSLLVELLTIPEPFDATKKTELIKKTLIRNNFNSWKFFHFLTEEIVNEVQQEETEKAQLLKFHYHLKCTNQLFYGLNQRLNPNIKPLDELLSTWLYEEIY